MKNFAICACLVLGWGCDKNEEAIVACEDVDPPNPGDDIDTFLVLNGGLACDGDALGATLCDYGKPLPVCGEASGIFEAQCSCNDSGDFECIKRVAEAERRNAECE